MCERALDKTANSELGLGLVGCGFGKEEGWVVGQELRTELSKSFVACLFDKR